MLQCRSFSAWYSRRTPSVSSHSHHRRRAPLYRSFRSHPSGGSHPGSPFIPALALVMALALILALALLVPAPPLALNPSFPRPAISEHPDWCPTWPILIFCCVSTGTYFISVNTSSQRRCVINPVLFSSLHTPVAIVSPFYLTIASALTSDTVLTDCLVRMYLLILLSQ